MKPIKSRLFNLLTIVAITLSVAFVACEGPAGPEGPQGPKGEVGPVGPAGEDGSVMYAGEGKPTADIGVNGDYYLNQRPGELYGPKEESGWGTPISLQGPPGDDGADGKDGKDGDDGKDGKNGKNGKDGSQIYAGAKAPKASQGKPGDYYLNTATFDLYGPKKGSGWGTPINLKGTANVLYSSWIDINWNSEDSKYVKTMMIPESRITDDFLDTGVVSMYLKSLWESDDYKRKNVFPLPYNFGYSFRATFEVVSYTGDPGGGIPADFKGMFLAFISENDEGIGIPFSKNDFQARYVLIPGGEQLGAKGTIDLNDYEQVKKYFGLQQ